MIKFKVRKIRKNKRQPKAKVRTLHPYLRYGALALGTLALMLIVRFSEQSGIWFKASVLDAPQPFNGTVPPVAQVPNWSKWKGSNATDPYSSIAASDLIDLPAYDLSIMDYPDDKLVWGKPEHDIYRNTKITYSTVYMGNYKLDHEENAGSHLAVDIKIPVGTPIHAIANGKVVKASTQNTGFGHHIVIMHPNAPDTENGGRTTLYSNYCHMDEIDVVEGQNVLKGQIIGTSGKSGTATTPHLHFQVDNDKAPWHPYWPFTWAEAQAAGLDFFSAINAGLGRDNAKNYTVNPFPYIVANLNSNIVVSNSNQGTQDVNNTPVVAVNEGVEIVDSPIDNPVSANAVDPSLFTFKLMGETVMKTDNGVTLTAIDEQNQIEKLQDGQEIRVELSGVGSLPKKTFTKADFVNHAIKIVVKSDEAGDSVVTIGRASHKVNFVSEVSNAVAFKFEQDGAFIKNVNETVYIVAVDADGNPTPVVNFNGIAQISVKEGSGLVIPSEITSRDFKNGRAEIRVRSSDENRIVLRVQQGAMVGESESMVAEGDSIFTDITRTNKNYEAIKFLKEAGIINGYSDGSFKPGQTVNRVEALKMLMLAFNVPAGPAGALPFSDTDNKAWYASTVATALSKAIVKGYADGSFKPAQVVNRAELLKMLTLTADENPNEVLSANPYSDVLTTDWFAPYAYMAKKKNLVEVSNDTLRPGEGMTRADVAEAIYRLKMIKDHNLVTYSK